MNEAQLQKQREANKRYRLSHPEKENARKQKWTKGRIGWMKSFKTTCYECGVSGKVARLHWHHIDPKTKLANPSDLRNSKQRFLDEIKKCRLLCVSCHNKTHSAMDHYDKLKKGEVETRPGYELV